MSFENLIINSNQNVHNSLAVCSLHMGSYLTTIINKLSSVEKRSISMLGLDAVGKSTILYQLKLGKAINSVPTIGFNVETVQHKNLQMTIWDVGGSYIGVMPLWKHYVQTSAALIFVIDSSDKERLSIAVKGFKSLMLEGEKFKIPVLIFLNKKDIGVITEKEIVELFELEKLEKEWRIFESCARKGEGLKEGLEWLAEALKTQPKQK